MVPVPGRREVFLSLRLVRRDVPDDGQRPSRCGDRLGARYDRVVCQVATPDYGSAAYHVRLAGCPLWCASPIGCRRQQRFLRNGLRRRGARARCGGFVRAAAPRFRGRARAERRTPGCDLRVRDGPAHIPGPDVEPHPPAQRASTAIVVARHVARLDPRHFGDDARWQRDLSISGTL